MRINQMKTNMKRNLLTFTAVGALALAGYAFAEPQGGFGGRHGGWHGQGFAMEHLTKSLNLTPDQQSRVQPLIDQARPHHRHSQRRDGKDARDHRQNNVADPSRAHARAAKEIRRASKSAPGHA